MKEQVEKDDLMLALASLPVQDPDGERSRSILLTARRAMARRRRLIEARLSVASTVYVRIVEPLLAGVLSAGQVAGVAAQAVFVLAHTRGGVL